MGTGRKILLVGLGRVGFSTLGILSRTPTITEGIDKIVTADVNEDIGIRYTNLALMTAEHLGIHPNLEFTKVDLFDVNRTAEQLKDINPDLIFAAVTLLPPWVSFNPRFFPSARARKLLSELDEAQIGPFLPMHLTLLYYLMQAIRKAGINPLVVNASNPDITAPVLKNAGLPYTVGIGNINWAIPRLKWITSQKLRVPTRNVTIFMVASHFVTNRALQGRVPDFAGVPYFLKVIVNGKDVTNKVDPFKTYIKKDLGLPKTPSVYERESSEDVAASAVAVIRGLLQDTKETIHTPGPNGLPGGYPTRVGREGVEVILPEELTLEEAIQINKEDNRFDGVEEIKDDGTVVFTEKSKKIMKEVLGYECKPFKPDESRERARELGAAFKAFGTKQGLPNFALKAIWASQ